MKQTIQQSTRPHADTDPLDEVHQRLAALLATPNDPATIATLDREVEEALRTQVADPDHPRHGGWTEEHPPGRALYSGGGYMLYSLRTLARAWNTPGSRHYHSTHLQDKFAQGWQACQRLVYPGCPFEGNWWAWEMAAPECMTDILLVAPDMLTRAQREAFRATLRHLVKHFRRRTSPGANGMSAAMMDLRYGVVARDAGYVEQAVANADRASAITDYEGILRDYSYSFHGRGLNMLYGSGHLEHLGQFTYLLSGSPWALSDTTLLNATNFFLRFARWVVVGDTIDPFIVDRGISMSEGRFHAAFVINAGLLLTTGPIPHAAQVRQACRWLIDQGNPPTHAVARCLAADLAPAAAPQPPLTGMRYFPDSEYAVMRSPQWTATIKMATEKNNCYFGINKTNLKGWHISDGQVILRATGEEYRDNVIPTMDWERLSGITRADGFKLPAETHGQSWYAAGAVSDDAAVGCCGMSLVILNLDRTSLNARKSWFFLGDAIVAVGTHVTCDGADEVETIIRHVALPEGCEPAQPSQQQVKSEILVGHDCCYVLPDRPPIVVRTEHRTGRWRDLRAYEGDPTDHARWFWTALIPHGRRPTDAEYVIVYLPGMSKAQARQWWQSRPFELIRHDAMHQVVDRRRSLRLTVRLWLGAQVEPL